MTNNKMDGDNHSSHEHSKERPEDPEEDKTLWRNPPFIGSTVEELGFMAFFLVCRSLLSSVDHK